MKHRSCSFCTAQGSGAAATGGDHHQVMEVVPFPCVSPEYCKILQSDWEIVLSRLLCPIIMPVDTFPIPSGSLRCTDPACTSQQPQRYLETDAMVDPDLLLNSALPISPRTRSSHGPLTQHCAESSWYPNPTGRPVWGCLWAPSPLERHLTLGTAKLSSDQAEL